MRFLRQLMCVAVGVAAVCAFASPRAFADTAPLPSCTPTQNQTVTSAHFLVSYSDDPAKADYIDQIQAGDILATAERAYNSYVSSGFPTPAVGASGKTELYILDLSQWNLSAIYCIGSVVEDTGTVTGDNKSFSISSDVFTQVERGVGSAQTWLMNGAAAWASWRALGYPAESTADLGPFEMSLDCDSAPDKANCSKNGYENLGGSRWPFYEYLSEKFGPVFIMDVFAAAEAAGRDGLTGLQNALAAKGTTLGAEYAGYATKLMQSGWTASSLNVAVPPISGTPIHTGATTGDTPPQTFGVNHLSTRFIEIDRGDGDGSHACYAATLTINVHIAAGVTSQPVFWWNATGSSPVALTVNGQTATASVPWDTCLWQSKGFLSLPNTSTTANGTDFVVSTHLDVNTAIPATSTPPPAQTPVYGPTVPAPDNVAPEISLFGPELLRVSASATELRLIVRSNAEGSVVAKFDSLTLGTSSLRPGGNDLRFTLPKSVLVRLRTSAATDVLTLTPTSSDGTTTGTVVTRSVAITPVKKLVVKAKKKAKLRSK